MRSITLISAVTVALLAIAAIVFGIVSNNESRKDAMWQQGTIVICNVTQVMGNEIEVSYKSNTQWVTVVYNEWSGLPSPVRFQEGEITTTVPCRTNEVKEDAIILVWHRSEWAFSFVFFFLSILIVSPTIGGLLVLFFAKLNINVRPFDNGSLMRGFDDDN